MKIYFAGSISGGQQDTKLYAEIIEYLKGFGTVLTEHVGQAVDEHDFEGLTDEDIYSMDMNWLLESDVVVAEVTQPSIGVGYEIGAAEALEKPTICLFRPSAGFRRSAMLATQNIEHLTYSSLENLKPQLEALLEAKS